MPQRCAFCGLVAPAPVCPGCHDDLPWQHECCPLCALPLPAGTPDGTPCATCQLKPPPFDAAFAPVEYAFPVDAAIRAFKFHRRLHYAPALASLLVEATPRLPAGIDAVVPVPLHRLRLMRRGFNQSTELALPVARCLGVPIIDSVRRVVATPYQPGFGAAERRRNLKSAFDVFGELDTGHILIVDDVITTGATCRELAATLKRNGSAYVTVLAVARA